MDKIVLYGCGGGTFRAAFPVISQRFEIAAIVDRNSDLWGKRIFGVPVIQLSEFISDNKYRTCKLVITVNDRNMRAVINKLRANDVTEYVAYYELLYGVEVRERITSWCSSQEAEDVILYHIFHDFEDIFYIDVGSNDPLWCSVTKFLYDTKNAHGINIEPLEEHAANTNIERKRDINLCLALGDTEKIAEFYVPMDMDALSTFQKDLLNDVGWYEVRPIKVTTLEKVCNQYVPEGQKISFLKIDVEGSEKQVLQGADFRKYRPMIIIMESGPVGYRLWEDILTGSQYHFAFSYGVNRYYVADECSDLDERFLPVDELKLRYDVSTMLRALGGQY